MSFAKKTILGKIWASRLKQGKQLKQQTLCNRYQQFFKITPLSVNFLTFIGNFNNNFCSVFFCLSLQNMTILRQIDKQILPWNQNYTKWSLLRANISKCEIDENICHKVKSCGTTLWTWWGARHTNKSNITAVCERLSCEKLESKYKFQNHAYVFCHTAVWLQSANAIQQICFVWNHRSKCSRNALLQTYACFFIILFLMNSCNIIKIEFEIVHKSMPI